MNGEAERMNDCLDNQTVFYILSSLFHSVDLESHLSNTVK